MANDETLAALERAANMMERPLELPSTREAAALIRALIERERNGGERAQIVAWLRQEYVDMMDAAHGNEMDMLQAEAILEAAQRIEAGAHLSSVT